MRQPSINWLERKILCVWINFIHGQQQCSGFLSRSEIREAFKNVTEMWSAVLMGLEGGSECRCKLQAKVWTFLLERKALRALACFWSEKPPDQLLATWYLPTQSHSRYERRERERERQLRAIKLPQVRSKFQPNTLRLCCSYFILHPLQKLHSVHTLSSLVCIFLC